MVTTGFEYAISSDTWYSLTCIIPIVVGASLVLVSLASVAFVIYRRRMSHPTTPPASPQHRPQFIIPLFVSPRVIRAFPTRLFHRGSGVDPEFCPICLYVYPEGISLSVLPQCNHAFHLACVLKCFRTSTKCPICRHEYNYLSPESLVDIHEDSDDGIELA